MLHLTINLTPAPLWQIDGYVAGQATDVAREPALTDPGVMTSLERERLLATFFDADWHSQIFFHARYRELFLQRRAGQRFDDQDMLDLQMWSNLAWTLLGSARDFLTVFGATPESAPAAFLALYMAEGSDWFRWFGDDQDSGRDAEFDDLFRTHLKNGYRSLGVEPPLELDLHIVPHVAIWTFVQPVKRVVQKDRLRALTSCPDVLHWQLEGGEPRSAPLVPVGGVMAGTRRHHLTLGPLHGSQVLRFRFQCTHPGCDGEDVRCNPAEQEVEILRSPVAALEGM